MADGETVARCDDIAKMNSIEYWNSLSPVDRAQAKRWEAYRNFFDKYTPPEPDKI